MSEKGSRPAWFKRFLHQKPLIDAVPDEAAGRAFKAALHYFDTREDADLDPLSLAVYSAIKPYIDEAFADFQRTSAKNRANVKRRWKPSVTTRTSGNDLIPSDTKNTEEEAEAEAEEETEEESVATPSALPKLTGKPKRTSYGHFGWVKLTSEQYSRLSNDLGEAELKWCIDYVDEAAQSTGNKNRWRDWNLVIRRCHRDGWGVGRAAAKAEPTRKPYAYDPGDTTGSL